MAKYQRKATKKYQDRLRDHMKAKGDQSVDRSTRDMYRQKGQTLPGRVKWGS